MRTRLALLGILSLSVIGLATSVGLAQGVATRAGQALDGVGRGIRQETQNLGSALRRRFDAVRSEVNRMGVPSRVYSRLHWDKALVSSRIEVHPVRGGSILLRGTVPDTETKNRALALASETVDVTSVVDELTVLNSSTTVTPTTTTTTITP
ncbi:BON domain-containing protein [Singulisphaera acidiphila]|uniref:Putative phospholipid-binding protein n=1 Tax=Singulisphaera acidiphila (strain ATCC BAA-1392 / DSM 18658 / VKM B-2454 / MOB10) TaxID=886293 RepID=L0DHJ4_SINAD|nr:BON domain-containing protein [Singulisphaera acidiphila]AGA28834.1 putative phospholipid-binding protein [Singulisphaera acidiphila DSM 18658]